MNHHRRSLCDPWTCGVCLKAMWGTFWVVPVCPRSVLQIVRGRIAPAARGAIGLPVEVGIYSELYSLLWAFSHSSGSFLCDKRKVTKSKKRCSPPRLDNTNIKSSRCLRDMDPCFISCSVKIRICMMLLSRSTARKVNTLLSMQHHGDLILQRLLRI